MPIINNFPLTYPVVPHSSDRLPDEADSSGSGSEQDVIIAPGPTSSTIYKYEEDVSEQPSGTHKLPPPNAGVYGWYYDNTGGIHVFGIDGSGEVFDAQRRIPPSDKEGIQQYSYNDFINWYMGVSGYEASLGFNHYQGVLLQPIDGPSEDIQLRDFSIPHSATLQGSANAQSDSQGEDNYSDPGDPEDYGPISGTKDEVPTDPYQPGDFGGPGVYV